ncbi:MAG: 50S ribosomal protein L18 [Candidatus Micrarchaeia archaeon]
MAKATGPKYYVTFRRKRERVTNYAKRLGLVKASLPRMVVRKSNAGVFVQFVNYDAAGDKPLATVASKSLEKDGWYPRCNAPTAYLAALKCAKAASKAGVKKFVLDIGMQTPSKGAIVFAALQGAIDAGLETSYEKEMVPGKKLNGSEIAQYAKTLKAGGKYDKMFSGYVKRKIEPEKLPEYFETAKKKIMSG